ncbi:hypothetical protein [Falsiroseomonas sp. HW251]|uniref:hypothetical protein n=1 Tax=Falsiroseomonas sp. HW251 TaxID=3390998 RepID=UPI003D3125D6
MADFVVVVVAAALSIPAVPAERSAATVPLSAPTVGFSIYRDAASCEAAVARMTPRAGTRMVCVPVEPRDMESASLF